MKPKMKSLYEIDEFSDEFTDPDKLESSYSDSDESIPNIINNEVYFSSILFECEEQAKQAMLN
jgi:hypothetical protein